MFVDAGGAEPRPPSRPRTTPPIHRQQSHQWHSQDKAHLQLGKPRLESKNIRVKQESVPHPQTPPISQPVPLLPLYTTP